MRRRAEGSKNKYEEQHFKSFIQRKSNLIDKVDFFKVANYEMGKSLEARALNVLNHDVTAIVYNFVDMLSHAKTDHGCPSKVHTVQRRRRR